MGFYLGRTLFGHVIKNIGLESLIRAREMVMWRVAKFTESKGLT